MFIYTKLDKFQSINQMKVFFENDVLYVNFHSIAIYSGIVFIKKITFINLMLTLLPEILIGSFLIALNFVSSETIDEQYMNKHDFIEEK